MRRGGRDARGGGGGRREEGRSKGKKEGGLFLPEPETNLLKSLMKDEIIREHNLVLQLFRYIVTKNFFLSVPAVVAGESTKKEEQT